MYYKGCNALYVEGVKSSSIYTIRAVMLCMLKVSKEVQMVLHIFAYNFLNNQPIFNPQKVLESQDLGFSNHNTMYVEACWRFRMSK